MAAEDLRRTRLRGLTKLLAGIGLVLLAIPFATSVLPPRDASSDRSSPWDIRHALDKLAVGGILRLDSPAGPVWVLRRSPEQVRALAESLESLRDPDSTHSRQPGAARNAWRSLDPEFFVFVPRETRRQCQVRDARATARWPAGFDEACEGARFDLAGRIFDDSGHPGQHNLPVPPHHYPEPGHLQLLPPGS
jgi:ubiquinol-cytochrome c reductase iron-sulfur subunit